MAFAPGDVVVLKSSSQPMTVVAIDDDNTECIWLGEEGALFRESIPSVALEAIIAVDEDEADTEEETDDEDSERDESDDEPKRRKA
jgi:uncharacterized protein YodC (DUF2158 family)